MEENPIDPVIEDTLRKERRKVFWKLYSLPWLLLTLALLFTCVILSHLLIKSGVKGKEPLGLDIRSLTIAKEEKAHEDGKRDIEELLRVKLSEREGEIGAKAILGLQIEAVSNKVARWEISINGERNFIWRTNLVEIGVEREYPFMIGDMSIARSIGLDLEKELIKGIRQVVEADTLGRSSEERKKLIGDLEKVIRGLFDGIETYKKGMR